MVLNGVKQEAVPSGVPQVSVLGLVIIFIKYDLPDQLNPELEVLYMIPSSA